MARQQESFNKNEMEKRKQQKKKEKEQKKAERKANAKSGASLDDMIAYVDENGNITSTPPDPTKKKEIKESDIVLGSRNTGSAGPAPVRKGKVTHFNDSKGYGFIRDMQTGESIFVHVSAVSFPIKENDQVTFETEQGPKGLSAVNVKKL
jgi:cold shock CspA family protein